jgi:hypothetical protein
MYRIEIEHEGHWLVGRDSGIDDLDGEFRTLKEARTTIKACADTERMEGREMPQTRIVSMATVAARALRAIPSERRTQASRDNGAKGEHPGRAPGPQPWVALGISRQAWHQRQAKGAH